MWVKTRLPGQARAGGNGRPTRPPAEVQVFTWVFRGSFFLLAEPLPAKKAGIRLGSCAAWASRRRADLSRRPRGSSEVKHSGWVPGPPRDQFSGPWLFSTAEARTINSSSLNTAGGFPWSGRARDRGRGGRRRRTEGQNPAPPGGPRRVWWLPWHVGARELQRAWWGGRWYVATCLGCIWLAGARAPGARGRRRRFATRTQSELI